MGSPHPNLTHSLKWKSGHFGVWVVVLNSQQQDSACWQCHRQPWPQSRALCLQGHCEVWEAPELGPQPGEPWPCRRLDLFLIRCGKFLNLSCGMAFAPCRKRARGPGGSNWFLSRTSCWNPAALIREVHFQVAVSSWWPHPLPVLSEKHPKI